LVNNNSGEHFCIVGGGLAGTLLSILLARRGISSHIYDKRPDVRKTEVEGGRSIVMSLSKRGWSALGAVGLHDKMLKISVPKYARMVHHLDGISNVQQYGRDDQALFSINRRALNSILLDKAEETGLVKIFFNQHCREINLDQCEVTFTNSKANEKIHRKYNRIIGADGIFSSVRSSIAKATGLENGLIKNDYIYKELLMPADKNANWAIPEHYIHVWPRSRCFLVGMPNFNSTFTCTLFYPEKGLPSVDFSNEVSILDFFKTNFPEVVSHIPDLARQFLEKKSSYMFSVMSNAWTYKDKAILLGDSAHAIVPFYGMGMNVAFEDCIIFNELIDEKNFDWNKIFPEFFRTRKPQADSIANLSMKNLSNLEHSVDPDFQFKWELERKIWEIYPDKWMPTYVMVAFSHIPFTAIEEISEKQKKTLEYLSQQDEIRNKFDCEEFPQVLANYIEYYTSNDLKEYLLAASKLNQSIMYQY
jgi:kynurenine 3-monooxygenase